MIRDIKSDEMPIPVNITYWDWEKAKYKRMADDKLMAEFLSMQKAAFDTVFGGNATKARQLIAGELQSRGIKEIPNIFGNIPVR
jgi:hypothetical protein